MDTTNNDRTAGLALGLAILLGFLGDRLLSEGPGGPGFVLWILGLGAAAVLVAWRAQPDAARAVAGWAAVAVAATAAMVMRDSDETFLGMMLVLLTAASMVLLRAGGLPLWTTRPADHVLGLAMVPARSAVGAVPLLSDVPVPQDNSRRRLLAVGRGALVALPLLLVFGALFASADAGFNRYAANLVTYWSEDLLAHVALALVFGWIAAGLLSGVRAKRLPRPLASFTPPRLGREETAIVLGLLALLFITFVAFQLGYLFGGRQAIEAASGLTVAEYARRGFFELMLVGIGTIAVLLVGDALTTERRIFRWGAWILVGCVLIILLSAVQRLVLYTDEFGLSVDRIAAAAVMGWVAVVLLLFAATVLQERPERFSSGAVLAGIATAFLLVLINPGEVAARSNLERAAMGGRAPDAAYLGRIGADAVPTIIQRLDEVPAPDRCVLAGTLLSRWGSGADANEEDDWRLWNASRSAARRAVEASEPALSTAAGGC